MVAPSFLALTSTPSMAPSSADETWPLSAAAVCACAGARVSHASALTRLVDASRALKRMFISLVGLFHSEYELPPYLHISKGRDRALWPEKRMAGTKPGHPKIERFRTGQSSGSTLTIEAPWLLPTQSTVRGPSSCTNTRRILVVRGSR